jgi:molybdopterin converting factor small subunit
VYHPRVLPFLKEQLARGELRPVFLYEKVPTLKISEQEIRGIDPEGASFINMNTPEEYHAALQRWQQSGDAQNSCSVELFGVARLLAKTSKVDISIPPGADLAYVISALAKKFPALAGRVIAPDFRWLTSGYACNINGTEFVRDPNFKIKDGDNVFILSADAGG